MTVLAYSTPSVLTEPEPTTVTVAVVGFKKFASILSSFPSITIRQIFPLFPKAVNAPDATGASIVAAYSDPWCRHDGYYKPLELSCPLSTLSLEAKNA